MRASSNAPKEHGENESTPPTLSCRSDYCANMKIIVIVKTNSYFFAPFFVTNTFRCVIGEFHHKIRFITISADIQNILRTTFKLCLKLRRNGSPI